LEDGWICIVRRGERFGDYWEAVGKHGGEREKGGNRRRGGKAWDKEKYLIK